MIQLSNFKNFAEAGQAILDFLSQHLPFQLWMITRTEGSDWIILLANNHGYDAVSNQVFDWSSSFCVHMVKGKAPKIAPSSLEIPLYQNARINQLLDIQSYIGEPIFLEDGSLFGTLCAIDPQPKSQDILKEANLIELLGQLLSNILQAELREQDQIRKSERLQVEALTDHLTHILNRRAWDDLITFEEKRCKKYGHSASVLIIDINNLKKINDELGHAAGDQLIIHTAHTLKASIRKGDVVARLGGDEFGILLIETNAENAKLFVHRIQNILSQQNISAAIGLSTRDPFKGLLHTIYDADLNMYQHKKHIKQQIDFV